MKIRHWRKRRRARNLLVNTARQLVLTNQRIEMAARKGIPPSPESLAMRTLLHSQLEDEVVMYESYL